MLHIDTVLCVLWKYSVSVRLKITKGISRTDQAATLKQQAFGVTFKHKKIRISKEYEKCYHRELLEKEKHRYKEHR